jgi:hypothetical protein
MKKIILSIFTAALILSGCNKSNDGPAGTGRLSIKITDDPFNISYVESATVTITKVELRKTGETSGNPFLVLTEDPVTIDLSKLRNGITNELVNMEIPQGDYDLVRLYIEDAGLKIVDQPVEYKLKVPGGSQTGIKVFIKPDLRVAGGLTTELLLDFDLSRSFVMRGNLKNSAGVNGFIFKPVIRATNNTTAGRIEGFVSNESDEKLVNAQVWVSQDTVVASTFTDDSGHYVFPGIPGGIYSVSSKMESYDSLGYSGVNVVEGNVTIQDIILTKTETP